MTSTTQVHDLRLYTVCAPHYGKQGEAYTRRFRPTFIANLYSETDDSGSSLAEYLLDIDEGSPAQAYTGNAQQRAKQAKMRKQRAKKSWKLLRLHITPESFRMACDAPGVVGDGQAALAIADQWFGTPGNNLTLQKQNAAWQAASIAAVGVDVSSLRRLAQYLQVLNGVGERQQAHMHTDNAIGVRFLSCITFPAVLEADAIKEMQIPTIVHPAGTAGNDPSGAPLAGQYNLVRLVQHFSQLWEAQHAATNIHDKPAPKSATPHSSNRVDGLALEAAIDQVSALAADPNQGGEIVAYQCSEVDEDGYAIYELEYKNAQGGVTKICWNCLGEGHQQRDRSKPAGQDWICPSPRTRRDPKTHMAALVKLAQDRGRGQRPRFRMAQRGAPRNRFAARPAAGNELEAAPPQQEELSLDTGVRRPG